MRETLVLAQKSFRKALRNKIFIIFLLFCIGLLFLTILLELLTFTAKLKITKDVGLAGISVFSALIAIFLSAEAIVGEIEKKTAYILFSKPVENKSFIIGSFLGVLWTAGVALLMSGAILLFLIYLKQGFIEPGLFMAFLFIGLEIIVIVSLGIMFSSFCSSALISSLLCLFGYILGHLNPQLRLLTKLVDSKFIKGFVVFLCWILPNLEYFNVREEVIKGYFIHPVFIGKILLYTFLYSAICLIIAQLIFQRRQL